MDLNPIRANMSEVTLGGLTVLFSYKTAVACHSADGGYKKTNKYWSKTTSRHINQWLALNGFDKSRGDVLKEVDQDVLDNLVK